MKIEGTPNTPKGLVSRAGKGAAKPEAGSGAAATAPQVELSSLSTRIQEIESSIASSPVINSERVAEIRQAIAQGNFKIDASKIADGLINSVRQMLAAKNQQP
ncbi:MAG: flagellar biosynthesis anti-sigma factor FlgM [Proteobacteria bacterium]|nr:flagellar biosynthesis anti-sigma factor FlgM [Pseudomonadota bacterium]